MLKGGIESHIRQDADHLPFFNRVFDDETFNILLLCLAYAMCSVIRLRLRREIPRQVQAVENASFHHLNGRARSAEYMYVLDDPIRDYKIQTNTSTL